MPDAPKAKGKKHGPFTTLGWVGVGGATFLAYYLYKRYTADSAASAATTAAEDALAGGDTIPSGDSTTGSTTTSTSTYSTWQDWESAAIPALIALRAHNAPGANDYSPTQAFNDLQAWYNGSCVSALGYSLIGQIIESQGLPPGGALSLTVCPSAGSSPAPTTPTTTPTSTNTHTLTQNFDVATGQTFAVTGVAQRGGSYRGYNVKAGTPVYALINGKWVLGAPSSQFGPNTLIGVLAPQEGAVNFAQGIIDEIL